MLNCRYQHIPKLFGRDAVKLGKTFAAHVSIALTIAVAAPSFSQELPSIFPGVTTLGERNIPAPVGLSPEMLEVVKERQIPAAERLFPSRTIRN